MVGSVKKTIRLLHRIVLFDSGTPDAEQLTIMVSNTEKISQYENFFIAL